MLVTCDELLSDSFPYKEIKNRILWEVDKEWVVQGVVDGDIGANNYAEGLDDQMANVIVVIVDTVRLQDQPPFYKKHFIAFIKGLIKSLTSKLDAEQ
ncbi:hypothetical protein Ddye_014771 [Dipteronia dyeriana]|uniref:TCTP domain-containing protein n=1 Tax=Dipteronia dyeriana TaxID=168575 RepID=A0AAD9WYP8_9ROSI|nr:hypothetical protein Ddye_014771 [Dipteronia dyeriana]